MFSGSIVALVTPFINGKVDYKKLGELVRYHTESGTDGIAPIGSTGECSTLQTDERYKILKTIVDTTRHKVPIIAGTGTNDTKTTIGYTKMAKKLGVDAALIVAPYYNKPTQEGIYRHYEAIAKNVNIPVVIYNVPGRTGINISPETVARLTSIKNIVAIKEASGSIEQIIQIKSLCDIPIISGDDSLTFPILCLGGKGVISVAANIIPKEIAELTRACENGNYERGRKLHNKYYKLFKALFIETNPIPIKTAMKLMGMLNGEMRLPLCEMGKENLKKLKAVLKGYSLV